MTQVNQMSAQEKALLISLLVWVKTRNKSQQDALTIFHRVMRHVEKGGSKAPMREIHKSAEDFWPDQLKRVLHPYIYGEAETAKILAELKSRYEMIQSWPAEWLSASFTTTN